MEQNNIIYNRHLCIEFKLMHGITTYRRPPHTTYFVSTLIHITFITDHVYDKLIWYTHIRIFLTLYLLHIC